MTDLGPVRFSHLRAYGKSAMHGHMARTAPDRKPSAAMELGSGVDALLFGHKDVLPYTGAVRRGKEYDAFVADHVGAIILTVNDFNKACAMTGAIKTCELAKPWLEGAYQETILFRWNGIDCRSTPDVHGDKFLTELKTSASSDPVKFPWHALGMHYHAQMRMQNIACRDMALDHYIVCIESKEPYPVTVFRVDEAALEAGEKLLVLWSERLKQCEASGQFPPYASCICPIELPDLEEAGLVFGEDE